MERALWTQMYGYNTSQKCEGKIDFLKAHMDHMHRTIANISKCNFLSEHFYSQHCQDFFFNGRG